MLGFFFSLSTASASDDPIFSLSSRMLLANVGSLAHLLERQLQVPHSNPSPSLLTHRGTCVSFSFQKLAEGNMRLLHTRIMLNDLTSNLRMVLWSLSHLCPKQPSMALKKCLLLNEVNQKTHQMFQTGFTNDISKFISLSINRTISLLPSSLKGLALTCNMPFGFPSHPFSVFPLFGGASSFLQ
jgi:hypothetical protein